MMRITVPGSKSITNRALLASALANGKSKLINPLESDDTKVMRRALPALLKKPSRPIFCGNSGTTLRFLAAVLATKPYASILTGDSRMQERPIKDLADELRQLGASVKFLKKNGFPPVRVQGPMLGGSCKVKGNVSSQFLSGLLLAAPLAQNPVTIKVQGNLVSKPYLDMTVDIMEHFGIRVKRSGYKKFFVKAPQQYRAKRFEIEGDASSASYFWAISALTGEPIEIINIPKNSKQADVIPRKSGIYKHLTNSYNLQPTTYNLNCRDFPDSSMTLAMLAAFRNGKTVLTGLANLRVKECDRLHALAVELRKIGACVKERRDGLEITGNPEKLKSAKIKTYNDHRMAMCFGVAQFFIPDIKIENPSCVKKTYPNFWKDLADLKKKFLQKNIILTGMRGSGKSRLGALVGRSLGRRFIDIDELLEKRAGRSIAEFVEKYGWKSFRRLEQKVVQSLRHVHSAVIATGGGTLMYSQNAKILKENGRIIFLECAVPSLQKRLAGNMERPALLGLVDFLSELPAVYEKRGKKYHAVADAVLNASHQTRDKKKDLEKKHKKLLHIIGRFGLL